MATRWLILFAASWVLAASAGKVSGAVASPAPAPSAASPAPEERQLEDLERRTFEFFWETTNPRNGLVPDRFPTPSFSSVAAVGFGLTAYPIGVERGYITRAQALERVLATLRFFRDAPQGVAATGMTGNKGFYYHFLDMQTGTRYSTKVELSTIDTALFLAGVLFCEGYFDRSDPAEGEARRLADRLYRRVDWRWASTAAGAVFLGWTPEAGFNRWSWHGYNEAMIIYLLGLGSPSKALPAGAWRQWTAGYDRAWGANGAQAYLTFPPLFGHQFSHIWIDFRGIRDEFMRDKALDYFQNSRRATYAQQAYAIANPLHWNGYGARLFGISASDGPADVTLPWEGGPRRFRRYAARGIGGARTYDDGTISPSALVSSIVFAPEIVLPALADMQRRYAAHIYSTYGFLDAFNPSFDFDAKISNGHRIPGVGWVDDDYLGIDEGAIIAMLENYHSGLIWRVMRKSPAVRRGLARAGFTGGWLDAAK